MFKKAILILILVTLFFPISKSLTSSSQNYSACIGWQGSFLSSSNYNLLLTSSSPLGVSSSLSYKLNLGFIPECIESFCCNNDSVCNYGETQENCPEDCGTEIKIIPSKGLVGDEVNVTISFSDSRYKHEMGTKIKINLIIGSTLNWNPLNSCFSDLIITLESSQQQQTCDWNYVAKQIRCGNYAGNMMISYDQNQNRLKITGKCKLPQLPPGDYSVNATVSLYLIKK